MQAARMARLGIGALALLTAGTGGAWAGGCVSATRSSDAFGSATLSADTTVRNATRSLPLVVEIYKDGKTKVQQTLQAGESASHLAKFGHGDNIGGKIRVAVYPKDAFRSSDCNYLVHYGAGHSTWQLQEGDEAVCAAGDMVEVACEKSFHSGKLRWNTTFTVTD